jgi:hypothetical protein
MAFRVLSLSTLSLLITYQQDWSLPLEKNPPSILEVAKKEFDRLLTYFVVPPTSPVAPNITVASKATPPYVCHCGQY